MNEPILILADEVHQTERSTDGLGVLYEKYPGDGTTDYVLHPDEFSAYVEVGSIVVRIVREAGGVLVELLPNGKEDETTLNECWAAYPELADEEYVPTTRFCQCEQECVEEVCPNCGKPVSVIPF